MLNKRVIRAFGKNYFLIGEDEQGEKYYLEEPKFSCGWYWGFGYIETFKKDLSDIKSHTHADFFVNWFTEWDTKKPKLVKTTFNNDEGWELAELFKRFYLFKEMAEYHHVGGASITSKCKAPNFADKKEWARINREIIPTFIERIIEIIAPKDELNIYKWKNQIEEIK